MSTEKQMNKKEEYWKTIVEKFKISKLTQTKFAELNNISKTQLSYWYLKLQVINANNKKLQQANNFIKVATSEINKKKEISYDLPDPKWVAKFIKELYASVG
ncbi:MAG: hypothetical protein HQK51_20900 [Oligoflexia bacterium]|nr:hypothetical protein [Oligoflexia bacterium]